MPMGWVNERLPIGKSEQLQEVLCYPACFVVSTQFWIAPMCSAICS